MQDAWRDRRRCELLSAPSTGPAVHELLHAIRERVLLLESCCCGHALLCLI
jgi:hypothetical protein